MNAHVTVIETSTGKKLTGDEAPLRKDLEKWLADHPGYVICPALNVMGPSLIQSYRIAGYFWAKNFQTQVHKSISMVLISNCKFLQWSQTIVQGVIACRISARAYIAHVQ